PESGRNDDQAASGATVTTPSNNGKALAHGRTIRVVTDEMNVAIDTHGGDLRNIALLEVPVSADDPDSPLHLINDSPPNFFIVQSGLSGDSAPNHDSTFQAAQDTYRMAPDQDVLRVPLTWQDDNGHKVTKIFTFHRGSYRIGLDHKVVNNTDQPWQVSQYTRF